MNKNTNLKSYTMFILITVFLGVIDQITKELARIYLTGSMDIPIIPNFIHLTRVENTGISFGWMTGVPDYIKTVLFIMIPLIVTLGMLVFLFLQYKKISLKEKSAYCLILGGAYGNLFDRIFYSSVTDFTHFKFFGNSLFVNNLADDFISIGLVIYVLPLVWWNKKTNN